MAQKYTNSNSPTPKSTLVQIPIDGTRVIGENPRLLILGSQGRSNL